MIVDGKAIAEEVFGEIKNEVTHLDHTPHLTVFTCAPNFETTKYLNLKTKKAKEVGIDMKLVELPETVNTDEFVAAIQNACLQTDGVMVQLPVPEHLDTKAIVAVIPPQMDVDGMNYDGSGNYPIHPVAGAIALIAQKNDVLFAGREVVVVGQGKLVGRPAALWAAGQGAHVTTLTKNTENNAKAIKDADILILGAGEPGLIKPDMIKEGVVIFDAGTSELGDRLAGDAHPDCAAKASLFTPVPGGIGPVTIAVLLHNVVTQVKDGK